MAGSDARDHLMGAYQAAVAAVDGRDAVQRALAEEPVEGPVRVAAVGKAAGSMMAGALDVLGNDLLTGLVIHPDGTPVPSARQLTVLAASHPVPDERSLQAGATLERFVRDAPGDAAFLFLLSGGASSLVECLADGGSLDGLAALNRRLLADGLPIDAMNRIRRAVSRIKGGRLGAHLRGRPARVLLISDVRGDDPSVIGSGLLIPPRDARSRPADLPAAYTDLLPPAEPGPSVDDEALAGVVWRVVAGNRTALEGGAAYLRGLGVPTTICPDFLGGDAVAEGERLASILAAAQPGAYLWGGEPSVTLPPDPREGGRMQALALSAARCLDGDSSVTLLAAGTDGIDGNSRAAGAIVDGTTRARGGVYGETDADEAIARANAGAFLRTSGDQLVTGPSGTNVMDIVIGIRNGAGAARTG